VIAPSVAQKDASPMPISVRRHAGTRVGLIPALPIVLLVAVLVMPSLIPGVIAPHDPNLPDLSKIQASPSRAHPMGTDSLGRDILSRVIYGARNSAIVAAVTIAVSALVGTMVGIVAGFYRGWVDAVLMRLADIVFSLPVIMVAITAAALYGPSLTVLVVVIVGVLWAEFARLIRGDVLALRERDFVRYAKTVGVSDTRIMATHILPNVWNSVVVFATLQVAWVILVEAALSFIGAGIPPPAPAWGSMVADGREVLRSAWWVSFFPGLAIWLVVLSLNGLGDWIRDRLDPRIVDGASARGRRPDVAT
jgi:peptide/nickel transport system permease protein